MFVAVSNYAVQVLSKLGFSDDAARAIAPRLTITSLDNGQFVWRKNQFLTSWSFLISGVVVGMSPLTNGRGLPMSLHGPQTWFGEMPILNQEPTVLDYVCATEVQIMRMPAEVLRDSVLRESAFASHMLQRLSRREQFQLDLIISLKLGSPIMRTALGLAQIAEALSAAPDEDATVAVPIKQSLVAAMCGVSRTLLSHYLQELQLAGWVQVHYSRLELVSPRAWIRLGRTLHHHRLAGRELAIADMVRELEAAA